MLRIVTREKAAEWAREHLEKPDSYMSCLDYAVAKGHFIRVADDAYAPVRTREGDSEWMLDAVIEFPGEFMAKNGLAGKYRYIEHVAKAGEGYAGPMERVGSFNLPGRRGGAR